MDIPMPLLFGEEEQLPVPAKGATLDEWYRWKKGHGPKRDCDLCSGLDILSFRPDDVIVEHAKLEYGPFEAARIRGHLTDAHSAYEAKEIEHEASKEAWRVLYRDRAKEIAAELRAEYLDDDTAELKFKDLHHIRVDRKPLTWLIKDFWLDDGFGVVGGAEKTLKSWTMLAAAVAVASGRPMFNCDRFAVSEPGDVLILTGEGGATLTLDRIEHLCQLYDLDRHNLDPYDVSDKIHVTDEIADSSSDVFKSSMAEAIRRLKPVLVIVDPAYVYLNGDDAGNVFSMGKKLADLRDTFGKRAVMIGHHFTKTGKDDLTLGSLTQAGFREAVDHWLLMRHAEHPDLDQQRFSLTCRMGARRGFGWEASFNVDLGPFNPETLSHDGVPTWTVGEAAASSKSDRKKDVYNTLRDAGRAMTAYELAEIVLEDEDEFRKINNDLRKLKESKLVVKVPGPRNQPTLWQIVDALAV